AEVPRDVDLPAPEFVVIVFGAPHEDTPGERYIVNERSLDAEGGRDHPADRGFPNPAVAGEKRDVAHAKPARYRPIAGRRFAVCKDSPIERPTLELHGRRKGDDGIERRFARGREAQRV